MANAAGAFPFPTAERHPDHPATELRPVEQQPTERALDHGIEESFPASDPLSVGVSKVQPRAPKVPTPTSAFEPVAAGPAHAFSGGALLGMSAIFAAGLALGQALGRRARRPVDGR